MPASIFVAGFRRIAFLYVFFLPVALYLHIGPVVRAVQPE